MYQKRFYRKWMGRSGAAGFEIAIRESDLFIQCDGDDAREAALAALKQARNEIESYISSNPLFKVTLVPIPVTRSAPKTVKSMAKAAEAWNVGPMAAVAGAVAESVGKRIETNRGTTIVENGGDIWAKAPGVLRFALYAGEESPFKDKIAFEIDARGGVGVCTSSGKVGPSLSFGNADAVVAISDDAAFADAAATSIANGIKTPEDVGYAVEEQRKKGALKGLVACLGNRLGIWGDVEIIKR